MKLPPGPRDAEWLALVLTDTDELLRDHAHCERKAAATAMSLVARHPDFPALVSEMATLASEELAHFAEVHRRILARGTTLGPDPGDPYAKALVDEVRGNGRERLVERLLISALIETRSFQRLRLLGDHHPDPELADMFATFAKEEARHGTLFVRLAKEAGVPEGWVDQRLQELTAFEEDLVDSLPLRIAIH
ncbi:MAG: tRNA isopentenyl-2-thiomethyl-A-37 hydroxylase MiaE [Myxococcota bacterium]|nr:tRNA isopentenyl-2-thiomethyl-A-37 hydroxylase MiaE [Myxococcota bacterium]